MESNKAICGMDVHKKFTQICVMDGKGEVIEERRLRHEGNGEELRQYFKRREEMVCIIEPVEQWGWVSDYLQEKGHEVRMANPYRTRLIAESRVKTDKVDARILAELYRSGFLPESYVAPLEIRDERSLLRYRIELARQRARLKNRILRLLRLEGISNPGYSDCFGKRGRVWLKQLELRPIHARIRDESFKIMEHYDEQIRVLNTQIRHRVKELPEIQRLMSIPGVGQLTAQVIMAEIGTMQRFPTPKHFAGYCGLGVSERSSGGKIRRGHITKQGNRWLRWLLIEGAQKAKSSDINLKRFYDRIAYKKGKAKATVAVARKLAEIIWHVVQDNTPYDSSKVGRRIG